MIYPLASIGQITLRFPAHWLVEKRQGLPMPSPGMGITYRGQVGLVHFRVEAFDQRLNLRAQLRQAVQTLLLSGVLQRQPGPVDFPVGIHRLVLNLDFPDRRFLFLQAAGFRFSAEHRLAYSCDFKVDYRKILLPDDTSYRAVRQTQESFLTWGAHRVPWQPLGPDPYRLQLRFSGVCAHFVGFDHLDGSIDQAFARLSTPIGIRLGQVTNPQNLRFNFDLAALVRPEFLEVLRVGGWFETGAHKSRRVRVKGGEILV